MTRKKLLYQKKCNESQIFGIDDILKTMKEKGLLGGENSMPIEMITEIKNFSQNFIGVIPDTRKDFQLKFKYKIPILD